jgi:hypothetical protein
VLTFDKAAFADVIAWFNDSAVLCRTKRCTGEGTTSTATFSDIVKELYKMGCRDPSVVAARWAATADLAAMKAKAPALGVSTKLKTKLGKATNAPRAVMALELLEKLKALDGQRAAATFAQKHFGDDALPCAATAAALAGVAKKRGTPRVPKVHYVIAVIGSALELSDAEAEVLRGLGSVNKGGTVQLLWAPLPTTKAGATNKESRRTRLAGYYPIHLSDEEPTELMDIPAPREP